MNSELLEGTRNAEVYLYREDDGYFLSVSGPGLTAEYPVSEEFAENFQGDWVDGETIKKREAAGDW